MQDAAGHPGRGRLFGFDENGEVYDAGDIVIRRIRDGYKAEVARLYQVYRDANLAAKGIVETVLRADGDLEHCKLVISYPYEWPANMYKDAVLFHLGLFGELEKCGLTLKDALPNNIVYDHAHPVFVDFLSLAPIGQLKEMSWLGASAYADARWAVADKMLLPYMVLPLLFMAMRQYRTARDLLSTRSCNCEGKPPSWGELLRQRPERSLGWLRRYRQSAAIATALLPARVRARRMDGSAFRALVRRLSDRLQALEVTPPPSAYSSYYDEKKEALSLADPAAFLPKQKAVLDILRARAPRSVLDIGANTGWFSALAANLGASVIALEEDEACVDLLYGRARKQDLRILPLKVSFGELSREIRGAGGGLLYRAGVDRLGTELVLVLGLFHHLVLGEGRPIDAVFEVLGRLAKKTLVLEFVSLEDEKIREDPGFFPSLSKFDAATYNLQIAIQAGRRHFSRVEARASHPASRTILVFDR
jgi:SAM-dependent methyltransferase